MSRFLGKFNQYTNGEFSYLRLSQINIYIREKIAEFCFVAPSESHQEATQRAEEIIKGVNRAFSTNLKTEIKIKRSHFDEYYFVLDLMRFFKNYSALKACVTKRNVRFKTTGDTFYVDITLKESEYDLFESTNLKKPLDEFVYNNYCEKIVVELHKSSEKEEFFEEDNGGFVYDSPEGRLITVTNVEPIVGYGIHAKASYIVDVNDEMSDAVVCGKVIEFKEFERKTEGKKYNKIYKFCIDDTTARMQCVFFASDKTADSIKRLAAGMEVIVCGKLDYNVYAGTKTLTMYARRISSCTFPANFKINRLKYKAAQNYKYVFPIPYTDFSQQSLLGREESVAPFLQGKEFCVFDLETTGLSVTTDSIIEIGAIKIKNGSIIEQFSTFIDPECAISERITKFTGITNDDVKNACLIQEALPDFFKFSENSILVGHNIESFDFPFIARVAARYNIYFDNERMDTLVLARNQIKLPKYKLWTVADYFGVKNIQSHRAVCDALTTAKVFIKLAQGL